MDQINEVEVAIYRDGHCSTSKDWWRELLTFGSYAPSPSYNRFEHGGPPVISAPEPSTVILIVAPFLLLILGSFIYRVTWKKR